MRKPNVDLNEEIVLKRKSDPKKWTFSALAKHYKFNAKSTVYEIWANNKKKYGVKKKKAVRV